MKDTFGLDDDDWIVYKEIVGPHYLVVVLTDCEHGLLATTCRVKMEGGQTARRKKRKCRR